jgi:FkbM family methyltransferase
MTCEELKILHDKRQEGLAPNQMCIREGIIVDINDEEARFGYEFFCWRSPDMVHEMEMFVQYAVGKESFLDVGAGHGIFSLVFSKINPKGLLFAIEPYKPSYDVLAKMTEKIGSRMHLANVAYSDTNGEMYIREQWGSFKVECVVGDDTLPFPVDIIKIDVEGHEQNVLNGLKKTITKYKPTIFLELHPDKCDIQPIMEMINEWNYLVLSSPKINSDEERIILL